MASVTEWSGASSAMHLLSILNDIMSVEPPESSSLESTASLALDIAPIIFSRHHFFAVRTIGRERIWFLSVSTKIGRLGVSGLPLRIYSSNNLGNTCNTERPSLRPNAHVQTHVQKQNLRA